jgi:short-subunit dehydrogenase
MELSNKKIVVTGASSGIGYELSLQLARKGADILATARNINDGIFNCSKIKTVQYDLRCAQNVDALIDSALESMGTIDIFVANAGFGYYGKTTPDWGHIEDIFKLNVFSPIYTLTKLCSIFTDKTFQFVVMDSGAGRIPLPGYSLYCSTKFALDGFMRTFRFELPANVKLSVVYPVSVKTPFFEKAANGAPPPRPVISAQTAARKIIEGIEQECEEIYPSKALPILLTMNRYCPIIEPAYQCTENSRFGGWLRNHNGLQPKS